MITIIVIKIILIILLDIFKTPFYNQFIFLNDGI